MRPIDEWDESYVLSDVEDADESEAFERKRTEALQQNKSIAKSVCAFANAGDGIIVYGMEDKTPGSRGTLDPTGGVPAVWKGDRIESWLLQKLTKFHQPPIINCAAKFVPIPS